MHKDRKKKKHQKQIIAIKIRSAKINKITNRRVQLFFERVGVNFKGMKEKRERKEKKLHRSPTRPSA
jgi:hypothetical protein